jgi:biofilm PGA synthesis N-glycosyltransferase PgaC
MIEVILAIALSVLIYTYAGYPGILWLVDLRRRRKSFVRFFEPTVSLIIPAYNEADRVSTKVRNSLALDYPPSKFEIFVVSDGCTDDTIDHAVAASDGRVKILELPHRGKLHAMNAAIQHARGEIVVFSDVSATLNRHAIRYLVRHYIDRKVGVVTGAYSLPRGACALDKAYWRYEAFVIGRESNLGILSAVHGALYSVRRSVYPVPQESFINDDDVIPVLLRARGFRVVYEPEAIAVEAESPPPTFAQRVRSFAGIFQICIAYLSLMIPITAAALFSFVSSKVLRLLTPVFLVAVLCSSAFLAGRPMYSVLLGLQLAFYALAVLGVGSRLRSPLALAPYYFCMRHAAIPIAVYHALFGFRRMKWR